MIPSYVALMAYLYGVACTASYFLLARYSSIFRLREWIVVSVVGWFISPIILLVWIIGEMFDLIERHW